MSNNLAISAYYRPSVVQRYSQSISTVISYLTHLVLDSPSQLCMTRVDQVGQGMSLTPANFKQQMEDTILQRGRRCYRSGYVVELEEVD